MSVNGGEDDSNSSYSSNGTTTPDSSGSENIVHNSSALVTIDSSDPSGELVEMHIRSYSKWCPAKQGATLVWRDVCVYANDDVRQHRGAGQLKRIINNSTGAIQPGTLMALMGSSGAGKSTLMSALAYRNSSNTTVQGDILLNGRTIGPFMYRLSGFVHQDDLFMGALTVLEHITFMAHLRLDRRITKMEKYSLIHDLLKRTGLTHCAYTRIGQGDATKVLSGGEKKRLAFASELLIKPTILFCDEPTTGLDSYSAQQLIRTLQSLARRGTTIMCTIHQPSSQLFSMFHQVMLLTEGRVAFMGTPSQALQFFASNGYECPASYNPADFLVGVLANAPGCERASQRSAHRLCDLFAVSQVSQQRDMLVNLEIHMSESCEFEKHTTVGDDDAVDRFRKPMWPVTVYWLIYRLMLTVVRDPTVQTMRAGQKIAIAFMVGLCFLGSIELTQYGVQAVQGALFLVVSENTFGPMYSVLAIFPMSFPLFIREKRSGTYDTVQYYVANVLAMIPGLIIEPLLFCVVGYWLAGLRPTWYAFAMTTLVAILVINVATSCGCFFSSAFNSVPMAMAYLVPFDYILMITSGVFVKLSTMASYISWMQYFSWFMYANEAMSIVQWEGIQNITCYEINVTDDLPCLHSGAAVLDQYSFDDTNLARDLIAMCSLYVIFNLLALFCLWRRARRMC